MKEFFFKYSHRDDLKAITTESETLSYKKLFDTSLKISGNFNSDILIRQKYIPVLSSNSKEFIITTIALWNAGLVPVPLNNRWTETEIKEVIKKYNFKVVLFENKFSDKLTSTQIEKFSFDDLLNPKSKPSQYTSNDESVVIFTSGSSSEPKGVVHTFDSLANSILNGEEILNQKVGDKWIASLPFYHIGGFQIICRALSGGCEIIIPANLKIDSIKNSITEFYPTHISLVSTQLKNFVDTNFNPVNSIKVSLVGGGFTDDSIIIESSKKGWKPVRVYGSSETASFVSAATADEILKKPETSGKAVKNVKIQTSSDGEILISSKSLFKCYLNDEETTKEKIKNGFYYSGDLGFIDEDGYLFIEARRNDLIVSGGENINPLEVEKVLMKNKSIKEVCVFPIQDKHWGQICAAAIVTNETVSEEVIKYELKKVLADFKIPKRIFFVDELPKTSLGKIEREKVRRMFS